MMFWIRRQFPVRTRSFDRFVRIIKGKGGVLVQGAVREKLKRRLFFKIIGLCGIFRYYIILKSRIESGREVIYKQSCKGIRKNAFVSLSKRIKQIKNILPGTAIYVDGQK